MTNRTDNELLDFAREIAFADEDGLSDTDALEQAGWLLLDDLHDGGDQEDNIRDIAARLDSTNPMAARNLRAALRDIMRR